MHGLVERKERLFEKLAQPLGHQQAGQVVLQLADLMPGEQIQRRLDIVGQPSRGDYGEAQHRLQRRFGQWHDRPRAPAFGQQLLDELEAGNLIVRVDAIAVGVASRRGESVAPMPHVELLAAQFGNPHDFADVQHPAMLRDGLRPGAWCRLGRSVPAVGCHFQYAHDRRSLTISSHACAGEGLARPDPERAVRGVAC